MATTAIAPRLPKDLMSGTMDVEPAQWGLMLPAEKLPDNFLPISTGNKSAIPRQLLFGALQSPTLRLLKPIPLKTEKAKDTISVVWEDISEFGYGTTLSEAIFDFAATVTELYVTLSVKESLSDDLLKVRSKLSEYIGLRLR
jgi:hypothetical protein